MGHANDAVNSEIRLQYIKKQALRFQQKTISHPELQGPVFHRETINSRFAGLSGRFRHLKTRERGHRTESAQSVPTVLAD